MANGIDTEFLAELPVFLEFEDVADLDRYKPLPDGWVLAIADIVDSTGAIASGRYKSVNMAGASVISGVLNAVGMTDLPFVFGGDGGVVAVPPGGVEPARLALAAVIRWVSEEFDLEMRAAIVPVDDMRKAGLDLRVARFRASDDVAYAMLAGGGSSWADAQMKAGAYAVTPAEPGTRPDLTGLSCRWSPIPSRHGEIVSIIAVPEHGTGDEKFRALIVEIVALVAVEERNGHPIPAEGPALGLTLAGLTAETAATAKPKRRLQRMSEILGQYLLTSFLFRTGITLGRFNAARYKRGVALNTDFRKFDDGLKMTIDVSSERLQKIEVLLETASKAGTCHYGIHRQKEALMTCIVPSPMSRNHMHFVDGASGGYAEAASRLKKSSAIVSMTAI